MRKKLPKILVTGAAGFIGSAFVRLLLNRDCPLRGLSLIVVDKLTYAGDLKRLDDVKGEYEFYKTDICNRRAIDSIFLKERPETVINFAAESHVDRSIKNATPFIETNIKGTQVLLDISRKYKIKRFIHISSDEVYGEIKKGSFSEDSPLRPNSPYAASKAAADLLIRSYIRTYQFPAIIIRPCNNYGPWQYPEKLIPLAILRILNNRRIPVYADGKNVREWLYVDDCAEGVLKIMEKGKTGQIYNLGSDVEKQNIAVVKGLLNILKYPQDRIEFVKDRPGHDIRYKINWQKARNHTGWQPKVAFDGGLKSVVRWALAHKDWLLSK